MNYEHQQTNQTSLFDSTAGTSARDKGMDAAARYRAYLLSVAKAIALDLGQRQKDVTADCVMRVLVTRGYDPSDLGPASGSIFKGGAFRFTGEFRQSERASNRGRYNRVWRLK